MRNFPSSVPMQPPHLSFPVGKKAHKRLCLSIRSKQSLDCRATQNFNQRFAEIVASFHRCFVSFPPASFCFPTPLSPAPCVFVHKPFFSPSFWVRRRDTELDTENYFFFLPGIFVFTAIFNLMQSQCFGFGKGQLDLASRPKGFFSSDWRKCFITILF